ncbi:unnamed protein product, partial [Musa hybrid cultivar]
IILKEKEYFNDISVSYGALSVCPGSGHAIKQLTIGTNKGTRVTVGTTKEADFSFPPPPLHPSPPHKIVGFFGRASTAIDAIGTYYKEINLG